MRFREFATQLNEGPLDSPEDLSNYDDVGAHVEDDADHESWAALAEVLRRVQANSEHASIPKISVPALVQMVKNVGSEAFNKDVLEKAKKVNNAKGNPALEYIQNTIDKIEPNDQGIEYVFINPIESIDGGTGGEGGGEMSADKAASTVSQMAKRAAK
jgi:hypothetical protein